MIELPFFELVKREAESKSIQYHQKNPTETCGSFTSCREDPLSSCEYAQAKNST